MIVSIDVDSTLYDSSALFAEIAANYHDTYLPVKADNWHEYHNHTNLGTLLKIFRKAHSREYVTEQVPYEDAVDVCQMIVDKGHHVYYVSDRHPQSETALREWLFTKGFIHSRSSTNVIVSRDKREWMKNHEPDVVIDDRVRTLAFARFELQSICFSIQQSWNVNLVKEIDGVNIYKTWQEIGTKLEEYL